MVLRICLADQLDLLFTGKNQEKTTERIRSEIPNGTGINLTTHSAEWTPLPIQKLIPVVAA
jgi:hypothetical protein